MQFDYISHYPLALLYLVEREADLTEDILGPGGYFNPFTTFTVAFRGNAVRRFVCTYRDADGRDIVFDKERQLGFGAEYRDRRLTWLD